MASITAPIHRLSVEDVYRMVEVGVLEEIDRVELVDGVLVDMVPIGAEHEDALEWLIDHFAGIAGRTWKVRVQSMLLATGGFRLPDMLIIDPLPRGTSPATGHLVIEVAETSQARDHEKARDYAAADVTEYGIVTSPHARSSCIAIRSPARTRKSRRSPTARRSSRCSPRRRRSTSAPCWADRVRAARGSCGPAKSRRTGCVARAARHAGGEDVEFFIAYDQRLVFATQARGSHTEEPH